VGERRLAGDSFVTVDQGLALENKVHELERQKNITDKRLHDLERQKNVTDDRLRYLEDILSLLLKRGTVATDSPQRVEKETVQTHSPHRVETETVQTDSPHICGSASTFSIYSLRSWSPEN
jgi:hypothetical protein